MRWQLTSFKTIYHKEEFLGLKAAPQNPFDLESEIV